MANSIDMITSVPTFTQPLPVKAGVTIQAGGFFAVDDLGRAVPPNDPTASRIAGRALAEFANILPGALDGDLTIPAERKAYICANSTTDPVTAADVLKLVYLEGPNVIRKTRTLLNQPAAGLLLGFDGIYPLVQMVSVMAADPAVLVNTAGGALSLTAAQSGITVVANVGAGLLTVTLPTATVGLVYNFMVKTTTVTGLRIRPLGVEQVEIPNTGLLGVGGKYLGSNNGSGCFIQLRCLTTGQWAVMAYGNTGSAWVIEP
jgi:hypothetical protein